ncbi:2-deoxy-scyllo-inosose synthase [Mycobacterium haemophilum]
MNKKIIQIGECKFPYFFGHDCFDEIGRRLNEIDADRFIIITDDTVAELHLDALLDVINSVTPVTILSHAPGESMKSLQCLSDYLDRAFIDGLSKRSIVISFGGGVPGNLAGLIASLIFRGIRLVHIPTTTIAAMDSVLSLKQGINIAGCKNHIGAYYQPHAIMTDTRLFQTLPDHELRSGLCETVKNCLAIDPDSIPGLRLALETDQLSSPPVMQWLLDVSIEAKTSVTVDDTYEQRAGLTLLYGHTVGHAIELIDYRRREANGLSHGLSIAIGMLVAARLSHARGWLPNQDLAVHDELVSKLGVTTDILDKVSTTEIINAIRSDQKRGLMNVSTNETPFILLEKLGKPAQTDNLPLVAVTFDEIEQAINNLKGSTFQACPCHRAV